MISNFKEEDFYYNDLQFKEGAFYYNDLHFVWEGSAWKNTHSIFAIKSTEFIVIPYPKGFLQRASIPVMYFPFLYKNVLVRILDDKI